jgi:hypothetical protein
VVKNETCHLLIGTRGTYVANNLFLKDNQNTQNHSSGTQNTVPVRKTRTQNPLRGIIEQPQ